MARREELRVITAQADGAEGVEVLDSDATARAFAQDIFPRKYSRWAQEVRDILASCRSMRAREARGVQHPPAAPNPAEQRRRDLEAQIARMQAELQEINQAEAA